MAPGELVNGVHNNQSSNGVNGHTERKLGVYDDVHFDPKLKPKDYQIKGTRPDSKILFLNVNILDSTGAEPYRGDVYIEGEQIIYVGSVPDVGSIQSDPKVRVIQGRGRTLMSGLGDAHTHFTWNEGDLGALGGLGVEEHTLVTARAAQTYLDSGYTMCFGAASAKERLDCVVRDAINAGQIPGPRYLANGKEMARRDGELVEGITAFAEGPLEMREVIRHHIGIGVDTIKLSISGEEICETRSAQDCYFSDDEMAACVDEAHRHGIRLCAHARARDAVKMCVKHRVDIIYHASWTDDEGMEMLEKAKSKHIVAPGINWLYATLYEAGAFGYSFEKAEQVGYKKEYENARRVLKEMHRGGDYGFAWTPHGTYARDLEHFVKLLDFTPMESILAATAGVAILFMREKELGKIKPGYFAGCILIDGNPLDDIAILQDHDKLNIIIINGRIHKASYKEFMRAMPEPAAAPKKCLTNYVSFTDGRGRPRIGHLDMESSTITPLAMPSGAPISTLYEVIELEAEPIPGGEPILQDSIQILPPISGRDVLAVGKNYSEHATEFNQSGYDASDKVDQPSHPVIFTKRSTSIIASGEDIYPHPKFTRSLDYEGEIGVIVGKPGFMIDESNAADHVWGYTIINDVTAREKQRDHKQFYIGKSADTFCPMVLNTIVHVPVLQLTGWYRVLSLCRRPICEKVARQTFINGQKRQDGTTDDLIFSVANLVKTLSEGTTLQPGDVLATGTPAGVGFGQDPPTFLKPGDTVEISVTGLGTLRSRVADATSPNRVAEQVAEVSVLPTYNLARTCGGAGLTQIGDKLLNVEEVGTGRESVVYFHGLGGNTEHYQPLINAAGLKESHKAYLFDLEGHGLSPTKASSQITIDTYADDLANIFSHDQFDIKSGVVVAHSMGCLVAMTFAMQHPSLVKKLILIGPPPSPLPAAAAEAQSKRAAVVRAGSMRACADAVATAGTSTKTKSERPIALSAVRGSLLSQHPEGYAKGCMALGGSANVTIDVSRLTMPTLIITGDEDKVSPVLLVRKVEGVMKNVRVEILKDCGHWYVYEDVDGVAKAVKAFL